MRVGCDDSIALLSGYAGALQRRELSPEDVPKAIDAMIAAGEISPEDRRRCVFWELAAFAAGGHEERLSLLD